MLFFNFICLFYLMVLINSHTISKRYANIDILDDTTDSIEDLNRERNARRKHDIFIHTYRRDGPKELNNKYTTSNINKHEGNNPYLPKSKRKHKSGHDNRPPLYKNEAERKRKWDIKKKTQRNTVQFYNTTTSGLYYTPTRVETKPDAQKTFDTYFTKEINVITDKVVQLKNRLDKLKSMTASVNTEKTTKERLFAVPSAVKMTTVETTTDINDDSVYAETMQLEALLNNIKAKAFQVLSEQNPAVTDLVTSAVTETAFEKDPVLHHIPTSNFVVSTLVAVDKYEDIFKRTLLKNLSDIIVVPKREEGAVTRSVREASREKHESTTLRELEEALQAEAKHLYKKVKCNKCLQKEIKDIVKKIKSKVGSEKITSKMKSTMKYKKPTKPLNKNQSKYTKKISPFSKKTTKKARRRSPKYKTTRTMEPTRVSTTTTVDDFVLLSLYEQILSKTHQDNVMNMLTTAPADTTEGTLSVDFNDAAIAENAETVTDIEELSDNELQWQEEKPLSANLTEKIDYKNFVNGYKYYLDFQRDQRNQNFSNLVKFQAHKHHKVDDIGKFILNKLPPVPTKKRRNIFDDSDMEYPDISTKSDDSWFKRHFYLYIDNGPPKKYHTSEAVTLKTATGKDIGLVAEATENVDFSDTESEYGKVLIDNKQGSMGTLDNLVKFFKAAPPKHEKVKETEKYTEEPKSDEYKLEEGGITIKFCEPQKVNNSDDFLYLNKIKKDLKKRYKSRTPRSRREVGDDYKRATIPFAKHNKKFKTTKPSLKDGYVNIDVLPASSAVVKLYNTNKKTNKIKKFINKLKFFKKKKKKPKPKYKREVYRTERFNPLKKLKNMFRPKSHEKANAVHSNSDYDIMNSHIDTFKPVRYNPWPTAEELRKQVPNITQEHPAMVENNTDVSEPQIADIPEMNMTKTALSWADNYEFTALDKITESSKKETTKHTRPLTDAPDIDGVITEDDKFTKPLALNKTNNVTTVNPAVNLNLVNKQDSKKCKDKFNNDNLINVNIKNINEVQEKAVVANLLDEINKIDKKLFSFGNNKNRKVESLDDVDIDLDDSNIERDVQINENLSDLDEGVLMPLAENFNENVSYMSPRSAEIRPATRVDSTIYDYFSDLILWHSDILNESPLNATWQFLRSSGDQESITQDMNKLNSKQQSNIVIPPRKQDHSDLYSNHWNNDVSDEKLLGQTVMVDPTILAYEDIPNEEKNAKRLIKYPGEITNSHPAVTTIYKKPKQKFVTPLPMTLEKFESFLKSNGIDVESVTSPLYEMTSLAETWSKMHKTKLNPDKIVAEQGRRNLQFDDRSYPEEQIEYFDKQIDYMESNLNSFTSRPATRQKRYTDPESDDEWYQSAENYERNVTTPRNDIKITVIDVDSLKDTDTTDKPTYILKPYFITSPYFNMGRGNTMQDRLTPFLKSDFGRYHQDTKKSRRKMKENQRVVKISGHGFKYDVWIGPHETGVTEKMSRTVANAPKAELWNASSASKIYVTLNANDIPKNKQPSGGNPRSVRSALHSHSTKMAAIFHSKNKNKPQKSKSNMTDGDELRDNVKSSRASHADVKVVQDSSEVSTMVTTAGPLLAANNVTETNHTGVQSDNIKDIIRRLFNKIKSSTIGIGRAKTTNNTSDYTYSEIPTTTKLPNMNYQKQQKRNAENCCYTANNVAAIEVVVDLIKDGEEREEDEEPPRRCKAKTKHTLATKKIINLDKLVNDHVKFETHATNSIQVRIAIPVDFSRKRAIEPVRVRKVFSAKFSKPVDLEYQIHSVQVPEPQSFMSKLTTTTVGQPIATVVISAPKAKEDNITPGMYLVVNKMPNGTLYLKKVSDAVYDDLTYNVTADLTHTSTTPMVSTSNATGAVKNKTKLIDKEFLEAINEQLLLLYENLTANNKHIVKRNTKPNKPSYWTKFKNYFGHEKVCKGKCRENATICSVCAASEEVMRELMIEFENLSKYIVDHCTEVQTFFWMNPKAGKNLKDLVHNIDQTLNYYYKRLKGKCRGKSCETFTTFLDKRAYKDSRNITDGPNITHANVTDVFKDEADKHINTAKTCKRAIKYDKGKEIKQVYSLDNINVNIICDPESSKKKEGDTTTQSMVMVNGDKPDIMSGLLAYYDVTTPRTFKRFKNKNVFFKILDRNKKREALIDERPLIADSGGSFWYEYMRRTRQGARSTTPTSKLVTTTDWSKIPFKNKLLQLYRTNGDVTTEKRTTKSDGKTESDSLMFGIKKLLDIYGSSDAVENYKKMFNNSLTETFKVSKETTRDTEKKNKSKKQKHRKLKVNTVVSVVDNIHTRRTTPSSVNISITLKNKAKTSLLQRLSTTLGKIFVTEIFNNEDDITQDLGIDETANSTNSPTTGSKDDKTPTIIIIDSNETKKKKKEIKKATGKSFLAMVLKKKSTEKEDVGMTQTTKAVTTT